MCVKGKYKIKTVVEPLLAQFLHGILHGHYPNSQIPSLSCVTSVVHFHHTEYPLSSSRMLNETCP